MTGIFSENLYKASFRSIIKGLFNEFMEDRHFNKFGVVQSVRTENNMTYATVQLQPNRTSFNTTQQPSTTIEVPVFFPLGIVSEVRAGSIMLILFCDNDITNFILSNDGFIDTPRHNDINDGVAIYGTFGNNNDIEGYNVSGKITASSTIEASGDIISKEDFKIESDEVNVSLKEHTHGAGTYVGQAKVTGESGKPIPEND